MRFALYGRKSVYSDKSDSVDNQFRMSLDYINFRFPDQIDSVEQYSDEDYTGANTNRPDLKRLIDDIESGFIDALVVYQLDRLSRDVRDFSNIYSLLEEHHIMFISIKENIDTTTPIGKAMMYVTVVFAQMERETIAARVTDNMLGLAKKGFWTGGNPPIGYVRQNIMVNGKRHVTIVPDPEGVKYVEWIFDTFLDNGYSLQSMETAFRHQRILTRNGRFFSTTQLHNILKMPFCVPAIPEVYDYYEAKGCIMDADSPREKWDGSVGVMVYGRTTEKNKRHQIQPPDKWLVCLGLHKPFISAEKWLAVQARFAANKFEKTKKYDIPLLKGALRCSCGSIMNVSRKKKLEGVSSWYYCLKRMRQGVEACERSQIKVELLDNKVLEVFRKIEEDPEIIKQYLEKELPRSTADVKSITAKITACEAKIGRLAASLALSEGSTAGKYIIAEMERMDADLQALKRERNLAIAEDRKNLNIVETAEQKAEEISKLMHGLDGFTAFEKNAIVRNILKKCVWDGTELSITL